MKPTLQDYTTVFRSAAALNLGLPFRKPAPPPRRGGRWRRLVFFPPFKSTGGLLSAWRCSGFIVAIVNRASVLREDALSPSPRPTSLGSTPDDQVVPRDEGFDYHATAYSGQAREAPTIEPHETVDVDHGDAEDLVRTVRLIDGADDNDPPPLQCRPTTG